MGYRRIMQNDQQDRADALAQEITAIREEILSKRKAARKRRVDLGDLPERKAALKSERALVIEGLKSTKEARHAERKQQLDSNAQTAKRRIKRARQAAARMGLFWGSYNDIIQRADTGRKLGELKFRGFRGTSV